MFKSCALYDACVNIGQPHQGVDVAPQYLKEHGLSEILNNQFHEIIKRPTFYLFENRHDDIQVNFEKMAKFANDMSHSQTEDLTEGHQVMTLGGDHSVAFATLMASLNFDPNMKVIWIDAHADLNTSTTSESENIHGMPVAFAMGLDHSQYKNLFNFKNYLKPENIVYIGIRDLDEGEIKYLNDHEIKVYTAREVKNLGIEKVISETKDYLLPNGNENLHVSYDIDAVDPLTCPSTGTTAEKGLELEDTCKLVSELRSLKNTVAFDLVEFNPHIGTEAEVQKTLEAVLKTMSITQPLHTHDKFQEQSVSL